jgi:opacity protein-like surface antigen
MYKRCWSWLALALLTMAPSLAGAGPTVELAGGWCLPMVDKNDILLDGYEVGVGLFAPARPWLQVGLSGGYSHLKTEGEILVREGTPYRPPKYGVPGSWDLFNLSVDARVGWGLDGPRQFWFAGGLGWYHLDAADAEWNGESVTNFPITNTVGLRLGAGGSLALTDRFRLGLHVRYSYTDFYRDY